MKNILEELWYGNICPDSYFGQTSAEEKKLLGYIVKHTDALLATFTEEQKEILEKRDDCQAELTGITEKDIFVYAFRLGARFALAVMEWDAGLPRT